LRLVFEQKQMINFAMDWSSTWVS